MSNLGWDRTSEGVCVVVASDRKSSIWIAYILNIYLDQVTTGFYVCILATENMHGSIGHRWYTQTTEKSWGLWRYLAKNVLFSIFSPHTVSFNRFSFFFRSAQSISITQYPKGKCIIFVTQYSMWYWILKLNMLEKQFTLYRTFSGMLESI